MQSCIRPFLYSNKRILLNYEITFCLATCKHLHFGKLKMQFSKENIKSVKCKRMQRTFKKSLKMLTIFAIIISYISLYHAYFKQ